MSWQPWGRQPGPKVAMTFLNQCNVLFILYDEIEIFLLANLVGFKLIKRVTTKVDSFRIKLASFIASKVPKVLIPKTRNWERFFLIS